MKINTLDAIFSFAKVRLQEEMDCLVYEVFLNEITKYIREQIHEHYSALEIVKLSVLINLLKRKAERYQIPHKLTTLLEVLESSTVVVYKGTYENQPLSQLLLQNQSMNEFDLKKSFEKFFKDYNV